MKIPLLLCLALVPQAEDDYTLAEGTHVHGLCWFRMERAGVTLAEEVRDVGESAWTRASRWCDVEPGEPWTVNICAERKEFVGMVEGLQPGAAKGTSSFAHWESRQVFAKVQPMQKERTFDQLGMPAVTLRRVSWELAEQVMTEVGGGEDRSPLWLREGLAEYVAQQAMVENSRAQEGLVCPAWSTFFAICQDLTLTGRMPSLEDILTGQSFEASDAERRAVHAVAFAYLTEQESFAPMVPLLARGEPLDLSPLMAGVGLDLWLYKKQPLWKEDSASLAVGVEGMVQVVAKGRDARCWRTGPPPAPEYKIEGEMHLYRDKDGMAQANVLFGRLHTGDYLQASFNSLRGFYVWSYDADADAEGKPAFTEVVKAPTYNTPARKWVPFSIVVQGDEARVKIDNIKMPPFSTKGREMVGLWGVGSFAGTSVVWRNLSCTALED